MPSEDICVKLKFNPEDLPVQSLATEAAVPASRLSADWLRQHFLQPPTWTPELADEHLLSTITSFKPASVLIPLVMRDQGLTLLLTHRAAHLNDHAGQISFPGGRCEDSDGSVVETALREAEEEVGLHRKHVDVIGILPEYLTGTGYQVTPVVALIQPPFELKIDSSEVASLFEVPLSFLMDGQNYQRRAFDLPNGQGQRVFYAIPYQQHFIWGATAGMLRNLFHLLRA
ncbi:CoA pyrophosphatase [Undibacterium sp. RTI2.2]|uniref:CoA pyrophosphatase n=1 Tax=Undibacterium sp. RTI2.2 TaxID=3048638 RepID=UPI002B238839|nr:CoA pyrophosphatase [Undibacterium sp. RTI2.2]MEB0116339.1 CoA pyrophosphatase [Undibacterium sp. RTI2.2]